MGACQLCGRRGPTISAALGVCVGCLRAHGRQAADRARAAHREARLAFDLPPEPPRAPGGLECERCANACRVGPGDRGYCAVRRREGGRFVGGSAGAAAVSWYHDPLPTNCVADWVCAGGTGAGYPRYASRPGPEIGRTNLAVFYEACTFDCLFCQNWHYRLRRASDRTASAAELGAQADEATACICFFGGDPTPQIGHALRASALAREAAGGRILRICWETNGSMHPRLLRDAAEISLATGGCIKVDLKAWDDAVHVALTGASNRRTLENFAWLAGRSRQRPAPPFLIASTLLVPGYVDAEEVGQIARFIAACDPDIPYALLAFHPSFRMDDLPTTSWRHATEAAEAARGAGLTRVRIGNAHLLCASS